MFLGEGRMKEIAQVVDNLLLITGLEFPKNSIMDLAEKLGIEYTLGTIDKNVSGIIFYDGNLPQIVVNESDVPVRQQFTLAHEIGHCVLGHIRKGELCFRDENFIYGDSEDERTIKESEANYFAGYLLVPTNKLKWAIKKAFWDVSLVARFFGVSEGVICNRLKFEGIEA
jgi:Zn-dependent peptidase ImmA (M78 family)